MLTFLRRLFSPSPQGPPSADEARRLARLLVSEIKLYNAATVARLREDPAAAQQMLQDLYRSYWTFAERVGHGPQTQLVFREEATRILADGDAQLLEPIWAKLLE